MTIEDKSAFLESLWDWNILNGCFGETKISPTDIDGIVERRGRFLVLETKLPGTPVKQGQLIVFERMARTEFFTVFIIWGHPGKCEGLTVLGRKGKFDYPKADTDQLRKFVAQWFSYANNHPAI